MKKSGIFTVFKKELFRFLKDKRTLTSLILPGILIYVIYSLMGGLTENIFGIEDGYKPRVVISGLPEEMKDMFPSDSFEISEFTSLEDSKQKLKDETLDAVIIFPENFFNDIYLYYPQNPDGLTAPNAEIYYNSASEKSTLAYSMATSILAGFEEAQSNMFDINRLTDPENNTYDLATEEDFASMMFTMMMPMLLVMFCVTGCMAVAPESIAGEKERGTIATMLVTPIRRGDIALGKIFALSILALISGISSAVGTIASLPKLMGGGMADFNMSMYGIGDYLFLSLVIISTTLLFVTLVSIISCFAKSVKEATSYTSPVMVLSMVIGIAGNIGGDGAKPLWAFFIPVYNSVQCITEIFAFEINPTHIIITAATNLAVMLVGMFVLTRMFNSEKIMFRK